MNLVRDVVGELISMFLGDARLSAGVVAVVALSALLIDVLGVEPLIGGAVLVVGCLAVLVGAVMSAARR